MSSVDRDPDRDYAATRALVETLQRLEHAAAERPNWLGHSESAAALDRALLFGATRSELDALRGSVDDHLHHLATVHGLAVVTDGGGLLRFKV